ncbi:ADYC domain-containing protein [Nannocystis sp. SCPEA4]|uniref:ADYC domain-containing protein n=1 Tax=Nannocystis sp. SCPEA4 TaxID=2996787 RepID=UPI002270AB6B|nr:ADYC domain-containing protein [Nannocystis sp. SCPEA4]MCY1058507.1 ADYC domain-containing protein [Nannocystis sp. SCPEA4]
MRTFSTSLAIPTVLALHTAACGDLAADSDGFAGADEDAVEFRDTSGDSDYECPGDIRCLGNSPWVGDYAFSNFPRFADTPKPDPYASATFEMTGATKVINDVEEEVTLGVTDEGRLTAVRTVNQQEVSVEGTIFTYTIQPTGGGPSTTVEIKVKSETTPSAGTYFDMPRYAIFTDIIPTDTDTFPEDPERPGWYHVCPQADGTNKAIVLKNVRLRYYEHLAELVSDDESVVLACERQALAKGATNVEVLPNSGWSVVTPNGTVNRHYGLQQYNALINAYRAFYSGDARTVQGTQIFFRDLAHSPPMFDQLDPSYLPPAPIVGSYQFVLESVYSTTGASCKSYSTFFPEGVHRNPVYSPPGDVFAEPTYEAWDDMDNCDDNTYDLPDHGSVASYVIRFVNPWGGGGSSG